METDPRQEYQDAIDRINRATDAEIDEAMAKPEAYRGLLVDRNKEILRLRFEVTRLRAELATARNDGIEAAAKVADDTRDRLAADAVFCQKHGMLGSVEVITRKSEAAKDIAAAIRAMKGEMV